MPPSDSVHVARMKKAGCIVVGKTAAPTLGFTGWTFSKAFGGFRFNIRSCVITHLVLRPRVTPTHRNNAQPMEPRTHSRGFVWRNVGSNRGSDGLSINRFGRRRFHSRTGVLRRSVWVQADVRKNSVDWYTTVEGTQASD
jgi:hypothetical protein